MRAGGSGRESIRIRAVRQWTAALVVVGVAASAGCSSSSRTNVAPSSTTVPTSTTTKAPTNKPVAVSSGCAAAFTAAEPWDDVEYPALQMTLSACASSAEWLSAAIHEQQLPGDPMHIGDWGDGPHATRVVLLLATCTVRSSVDRPACVGVRGLGAGLGP